MLLILIYLINACLIYGDFAEIHHIWDNPRLCNNGIVHNSTRMCTGQAYQGNIPCDDRKISNGRCREVALEMESFTYENLLKLLPTIDSDITFRRILIKLTSTENVDFKQLGIEIDKFLLSRLWWYVSKEPYAWSEEVHKKHLTGIMKHMIVFDRIQHGFEKELRIISSHQYPSTPTQCDIYPMVVGHADMIHPGWLPVLSYWATSIGTFPSAIFGIYVSYQNRPEDSPGFMTGSDCPDILNKWECAFLLPTNCSIPSILTNCNTNGCVNNMFPDNIPYSFLFANATRTGTYVASNSKQYNEIVSLSKKFNPEHHYNAELQAYLKKPENSFDTPMMKYLKPYTNRAPWHGMMAVGVYPLLKLLYRQTSFYRSEVARMIHRFRIINNFDKSQRCVAAQIRRGDRTLANVNSSSMIEFCIKNRLDVGRIGDLGCFSTPFAAVTLKHVIESAMTLVPSDDVHHLIVATDDEPWLIEQIEVVKHIYPKWKILFLESPKSKKIQDKQDTNFSEDSYYFMRAKGGTASGTFWWSSIELGRQCEGFVGHFGSGATMFFHQALCEQHQDYENVCPPTFDVRSIEELKTHLDP